MNPAVRALLVTFIAVGGFVGVVFLIGGTATGLRIPAEDFLRGYWGEEASGTAARSSERYQRVLSKTHSEDLRAQRRELLGEIREILEITRDELETQELGHIEMLVAFEKGRATVLFEMERVSGAWKVNAFEVEIPRLDDSPDMRLNPKEFSRRLLWKWAEDEEKAKLAWTRFDGELRARFPEERFREMRAALIDKAGAYVSIKRTSFRQIDDDTIEARYDLTFENGTRAGRVKMVWRKAAWYVVEFEVEGLE